MIIAKQIEPYLKNLRGAIHVGANIGEERYWYWEQGFTQVVWFEPNRELFPQLRDNLKEFPNQIAFNIGVHDQLTEALLHISNNDGQSSSLLKLGTHAISHPTVEYIKDQKVWLMRMDTFLSRTGTNIEDFNFLNVDVQGVELNVIKSFGDLLGKLDYVYAEVNEEEIYQGCALISEVDAYLKDFSFVRKLTHITKAKWGDAFYIKKNLL